MLESFEQVVDDLGLQQITYSSAIMVCNKIYNFLVFWDATTLMWAQYYA